MKVFKVIVISTVILILLTLGGFYMNQELERQYILEIVQSDEVKKIIENDLKQMDNNRDLITNYTVVMETVEKNPMGGVKFKIYVNDDIDLYVFYSIDKDISTGKLYPTGGGHSQKLDKLISEVQ